MATIAAALRRPRTRELLSLVVVGILIAIGFASVYIAQKSQVSTASLSYALFFFGLYVAAHVVARFTVPNADPYVLPIAGLLAAVAGLGLSAVVATVPHPLYALPAAVLLGVAYGTLLVTGLWEVERLADPDELAALVALFYALTYLGFAVPFLVAVLAERIGYVVCFLVGAAIVSANIPPTIRAIARASAAPAAPDA
jgi:hypothetical protein